MNVSPPHGLALLESGDHMELVSAPEPLSQAAMELLSIVAYEQPITCAEISIMGGRHRKREKPR